MKIFRAIDLFAGIGGIRRGFEQAFSNQIEFVFSCEIDRKCRKTYYANFKEIPKIDIRKYPIDKIRNFNILLAGFPCQSFSIAGKRKGLNDEYGNLFYYIRDIIKKKQPSAFLLENVDSLIMHDKGRTFLIIKQILESELKYYIHYKILNALDFGLPQNRKRVYIVGFKKNYAFNFPQIISNQIAIGSILEKNVPRKYYLSQQYLDTLEKHRVRHQSKGHGFGYQIISKDDIANTLVSGGMGLERNLIQEENINYNFWKEGESLKKKNNKGIRFLTLRECARLQGFSEKFLFPVPISYAYKQIAKSVPIDVVREIALEMKKSFEKRIILKMSRKLQLSLTHFFDNLV